jgi:hypothetical protein
VQHAIRTLQAIRASLERSAVFGQPPAGQAAAASRTRRATPRVTQRRAP